MNADEWEVSENPRRMLRQIKPYTALSDRKLRLFAVGVCRLMWKHMPTNSRDSVLVAERFADGKATHEELVKARRTAQSDWDETWRLGEVETAAMLADECCHSSAITAAEWMVRDAVRPTKKAVADLLRCLVGNPFRPVVWGESICLLMECEEPWRGCRFPRKVLTEGVLMGEPARLAEHIYEENDFSLTPILADAIEEGGCEYHPLLDHLRNTSLPHYRGDWAVDLILRKE